MTRFSHLQNVPLNRIGKFNLHGHAYWAGCSGAPENFRLFRRTNRNGIKYVVMQCMTCARRDTVPGKYVEDIDRLPIIGHELRDSLKPKFEEWHEEFRRNRETEKRAKYEQYLESNEWKAKRKLVIDRASGICENCENAPVDHVHHLTYERLGNEDLADLLALCKPCHETYHGRKL